MEFLTIDTDAAQKVVDEADEKIAKLEAEIRALEESKQAAQDALDIASGKKQLSVTGSRSRTASTAKKTASESVEPGQVVEAIKAAGGTATLDQLKDALGVGGRVIGGALRRDDGASFKKDTDGNYVTV